MIGFEANSISISPFSLGGVFDFVKEKLLGDDGRLDIPGVTGPVVPGTPPINLPFPSDLPPRRPPVPRAPRPPGPTTFAPIAPSGPCIFPFVRQADGSCEFDLDPGAGTGLPFGNGGGAPSGGRAASGLARPTVRSVAVQDCPTFADGKKGLLWMNALTGEVVCLPRGTNGRGFGLIRKNKPRAKPFISAAMKKQLGVSAAASKKAKEFAKLTGQVCEAKSVRAARNARGR